MKAIDMNWRVFDRKYISKRALNVSFLYGTIDGMNEVFPPKECSYGTFMKVRKKINDRIEWIYSNILSEYGVLIIDGWNPEYDWMKTLLDNAGEMPYNSIYLFGVTGSVLNNEDVKALIDNGILQIDERSFARALEEIGFFDDVSDDFREEYGTEEKIITVKNEKTLVILPVSNEEIMRLDSHITVLHDDIWHSNSAYHPDTESLYAKFQQQADIPVWYLYDDRQAFEKWSIELYTVYHDYGCEYLSYILSGNILPFAIKNDLKEANRHLYHVNRIFRNNFAHGILDVSSRNKMRDEISKYCTKKAKGEKWDSYFQTFTDDDWRKAAERLKRDADNLLDTLYKWADVAENDRDMLNPRENFGKSCEFKNSISMRVVFDSLDKDFSDSSRHSALKILDGETDGNSSQKNSEKKLQEWQNDIQQEFLNGTIQTAEDIVLKIKNLLYVIHNPPEESSIAIANRNGFSLDDF